MFFILCLATLAISLVTLLPLLRHSHWIIRGMDFPRLQFACLAFILLLLHFFFLDLKSISSWVLILLTFSCFIWQAWWIIPYTTLWPKEVKTVKDCDPAYQLRILNANVLATNKNSDALLRLVKTYNPHILVTLESNQWWQNQLDALEPIMPYSIKCPLENLYGMHVYSRLPLQDSEIKFLVEDDIPSMHTLLSLPTGDSIRMHFLHPAPPSPTENPESSERDAELVIVARSINDSDQPVIVTGDLNDVAWSSTTRLFRKLSGLLDPRVGRGMFNTFHANYPFLRWPLDHLFHSKHFTLSNIKRLPPIGSDHFAIFAELSLTIKQGVEQEGLEADKNAHDWGIDIANEKNVSKDKVPTPGE